MESRTSPSPEPRADADASPIPASAATLDIRTEGSDGVVRIRLSGELDILTAPLLVDVLEQLGTPEHHVVIDMSELRFMDRSGLAALAAAASDPSRPSSLAVTGCRPHIRRVFELTGLEQLLEGGEPA